MTHIMRNPSYISNSKINLRCRILIKIIVTGNKIKDLEQDILRVIKSLVLLLYGMWLLV